MVQKRMLQKTKVLVAVVLGLTTGVHAEDDDLKMRGILEAKSETSVTVGGTEYLVTGSTEYENSTDQRIALDDLPLGVVVKVEYIVLSSGALRATEVEIEGSRDGRRRNRSNRGHDDSATDSTFYKRKNERIRFRLEAVGDSLAKAKVEHESKRDERKFKVALKLPQASPLAPSDNAAASLLRVVATVSRGDTPYAVCTLALKPKDDTAYGFEWKSEQELKQRRAWGSRPGTERLRSKAGVCDTDLAQVGTQPGVPNVQRGDAVTIAVNDVGVAAGQTR